MGEKRTGVTRTASDRTWLGGVGAVVAAIALSALAGPPGIAAGALVVALWYAAPAVYAFAVGSVLAATLVPNPTPGRLLPVGVGLFALLAGSAFADDEPVRVLVAFAALALGLFGVVRWSVRAVGVTAAAIVLVAVAALIGYGLHRYERVRLGLVEGEA